MELFLLISKGNNTYVFKEKRNRRYTSPELKTLNQERIYQINLYLLFKQPISVVQV